MSAIRPRLKVTYRRFGDKVEGIVCQNVRSALNAWYYGQDAS